MDLLDGRAWYEKVDPSFWKFTQELEGFAKKMKAVILVEFSGEVQLPNEVLQEAEKQGVGFIRAKELKDFATWETILDPRPRTPEPSEIDNFIRNSDFR
jgi:hypothetical protein